MLEKMQKRLEDFRIALWRSHQLTLEVRIGLGDVPALLLPDGYELVADSGDKFDLWRAAPNGSLRLLEPDLSEFTALQRCVTLCDGEV